MPATDVVIIGGGVTGCAIAYFLRSLHVDVTLLERDEIGSQASGAAAGLLAPLGPLSGPGTLADLVLAGYRELVALLPALEAYSDISTGYEQTGSLRIVRNPKRVAHLQKRFINWQPLGLRMQWLTGEEARSYELLLGPETLAAVYSPDEAQLHAASLVQAFARTAQRAGAHILQHQEVTRLHTHNTRVVAVSTLQGETFACQNVLIASGAWASQCAAWLNVALPIQPLHGQLLACIPTPHSPSHLRHLVFGEGAYLIPRGDHILVGATKAERGFDHSATEQGTSWLYETMGRLAPELAKSTIQATWAGLRPRTPDGLPLLGTLPGWENAFIAAGHNSIGIILSAITGRCMADLLTSGTMSPLIQNCSPQRFLPQHR